MDTQEYRAMSKEDKHILLKSFCEALHYHTICHTNNGDYELLGIDIEKEEVRLDAPVYDEGDDIYNIYCYGDVMPYLRPMSDMTAEEFAYIKQRWVFTEKCRDENDIMDVVNRVCVEVCDAYSFVEWLNANHFDYRGLIPMGLALSATEGMYQ